MSSLQTKGITTYYIGLHLTENRDMEIKTLKHNKIEYFKQLTLHERINLKSWYPLINPTTCKTDKTLFHILHLINLDFCKAPNIVNAEI